MKPSESELLVARLSRMKYLLDALEATTADTAEHRETFQKLRQELEAARAALRPAPR